MGEMRDCHRFFLQSFMSRGILESSDVRKLYRLACTRFNEPQNDSGLVDMVKVINSNIKPFSLAMKKVIREDTGTHYYGLINTADSPITRLAPEFSPTDLALFKKLLEKIVESDTGTVSSTEAVNLADEMDQRVSKQDCQALWDRMREGNWLMQTKTGQIALSPRSILELSQYIQDQYPDMATKCNLCNELCLQRHGVCRQGQCCDTCDVKIHFHCASRYFHTHPCETPTCPGRSCQAEWPHQIPNMEKGRGHVVGGQTQRDGDPVERATPGPSLTRQTHKRKSRDI